MWFFNSLLIISVLSLAPSSSQAVKEQPQQEEVRSVDFDVPVEMDSRNFQALIRDPKRNFWFLKFYAPYDQQSIIMAPVLGKVAKTVKDQMAVGKLDCTRFKPTCTKLGIRGYPNFKFSLDGILYDYVGGLDEASIVAFGQRMTSPPVLTVHSMEEAEQLAHFQTDYGVAFLVADPTSSSLKESQYFAIFEKVAREHQATAHFLWLETTGATKDDSTESTSQLLPIVLRLEPGIVQPREWDASNYSVEYLSAWVKNHSVPSLVTLGDHNFLRMSKRGRPLVMGLVDMGNKDQTDAVKVHMMAYIQSTAPEEVDKYYYGIFDSKWTHFLEEFGVSPEDIPQFLIFDAAQDKYWRDETYTTLPKFVEAVRDESIVPKKKGRSTFGERGLHWIAEVFLDFYPLSLGGAMMFLCLLVVLATTPPTTPEQVTIGKAPTKQSHQKQEANPRQKYTKKND